MALRSYAGNMLHAFLHTNRAELTARCQAKVANRASTASTTAELERGIPILIEELINMLGAERSDPTAANADTDRTAAQHGGELLRKG